MRVRAVIASLLCLVGTARAAVVVVPSLSTSGGDPTAPTARVASGAQTSVNLEDRSGLTPGSLVRITVATAAPMVWTGAFVYGSGDLEFAVSATLSAIVGGYEGSATVHFGETYPGISPGSGTTGVVGYYTGPLLVEFSFTVPWKTDLSSVLIGISQDSRLRGSGAGFTSSTLTAAGQISSAPLDDLGPIQISLQTIPEPSATILTALSLGAFLRRGRKRA